MEISRNKVDGEYRNIGLYPDNAKPYIQLSTGALLLSVTFSESLSGQPAVQVRKLYLWISWLGWLGAKCQTFYIRKKPPTSAGCWALDVRRHRYHAGI